MNKTLLYNYFENKTSLEEEKEIRIWLEEDPQHAEELQKSRRFHDAILLHGDISVLRKPLFQRRWVQECGKIAAVAIITMVFSFFTFNQKPKDIPTNELFSPKGERAELTLSDGTKVWLNSNTRITYPGTFTGDTRQVKIDGQAYFEVTPDKKKPFIVATPYAKIQVLGTKFDVEAYREAKHFEVALMQGSVQVTSPYATVRLEPHQKAILLGKKLYVSSIKDLSSYRWRQGLVSFKQVSFKKILAAFERLYDVKINVKHMERYRLPLTAKFRTIDGLDRNLSILQHEIPFTYKWEAENNIIHLFIHKN